MEVVFGLTDSRQRGKGVWKFNNTLLDDKAFGREITYVYSFWKACANEYPDKLEWWDEVKAHFKKVAITHSVRKIRNREKLETSLRYKLTTLKNELHPDVNAISTIEQQLRELVTKRLEGAKMARKRRKTDEVFLQPRTNKTKTSRHHKTNDSTRRDYITKRHTAGNCGFLPKTLHGRGGRRRNTKMVP